MTRLLIFSFLILLAGRVSAEPGYGEVRSGNKAYQAGDFKAAAGHYEKAAEKNPRQALIDYNRGTAYYKEGKFDKAVEYLQRGLLADDKIANRNAHYNLGNAKYMMGVAAEDRDIASAVRSLEEALPHYEKVMAEDPQDEDAKVNHEFVKKELARLKKKAETQEKQKSSKTCPNPQKGDSSQGQDKKSNESQGQDQGQSGTDERSSPTQDKGQDDGAQGKDQQGREQVQSHAADHKSDEPPEAESGQKDSSQKKQEPSSGQSDQGQILSPKEARMLLDNFDQNEQPQGLMNFIRKTGDEPSVDKDW